LVEGDGGDRRADVLFGWGPAVAGQVARWTAPQPRLEVVGVPGLARATRRRRDSRLQRVLVATTTGPFGTALAPWSTREDFLDALGDGLDRLRKAGIGIELRLHPREPTAEYEIMEGRAGRDPLPLAPPGPFAKVAERADLLIAPYSSVAFEAAALDIPVAMWIPDVTAAVRAHFVPPLSEDLPGTFANAAGFDGLVARALDDRAGGLDTALSLSRNLGAYIAPLDTGRFASALVELGS
jgi:ABC-type amino acid transport substrate-binding protein